MFGNGGFGGEFPFNFSEIFDTILKNIEISKDEEGIIIRYTSLPPGADISALKDMVDKAIHSRGLPSFEQLLSGGVGGLLNFGDSGDEEDYDENRDDGGESVAGVEFELDNDGEDAGEGEDEDDGKIEVKYLESEDGIKIVPENKDLINDLYEEFKQTLNPEYMQEALQEFMKMFQDKIGSLFGSMMGMLGGEEGDDDEDIDNDEALEDGSDRGRRADKDTNSTGDYFYT
ncbi:MAG: hypothetical protein ACTSVI_09655 [Promethearchaeota archaeon]